MNHDILTIENIYEYMKATTTRLLWIKYNQDCLIEKNLFKTLIMYGKKNNQIFYTYMIKDFIENMWKEKFILILCEEISKQNVFQKKIQEKYVQEENSQEEFFELSDEECEDIRLFYIYPLEFLLDCAFHYTICSDKNLAFSNLALYKDFSLFLSLCLSYDGVQRLQSLGCAKPRQYWLHCIINSMITLVVKADKKGYTGIVAKRMGLCIFFINACADFHVIIHPLFFQAFIKKTDSIKVSEYDKNYFANFGDSISDCVKQNIILAIEQNNLVKYVHSNRTVQKNLFKDSKYKRCFDILASSRDEFC